MKDILCERDEKIVSIAFKSVKDMATEKSKRKLPGREHIVFALGMKAAIVILKEELRIK